MNCKIPDCDRKIRSSGVCSKHYQLGITPKKKVCKAPLCNLPVRSKGRCNKHYKRFLRHGDDFKLNVLSSDHRAMSQQEWNGVLHMETISDRALDYLIGVSGPWRESCGRFKKERAQRVALLRHMTLTQQCLYYRKRAFIQMGQS